MPLEGWLYDGQSAIRHPAEIRASGAGILVAWDGLELRVPSADLIPIDSRPDVQIYGHRELSGWRLGRPRPVPAPLATLLPAATKYGGLIDRIGLGRTVVIGVAISALVILGVLRFPEIAAPYVPMSWERKIGDTMFAQVDERFCTAPAGQAALRKLAGRLSPDSAKIDIQVVKIGAVNAAALPGSRILIFDELLTDAESPDELAGILAHEIAHVEQRHVAESMIREFGLGLVGGHTGATLTGLMSAGFSRDAEREADDESIRMLVSANISPAPTARFFRRMGSAEAALGRVGEGLSYLSTHPMSVERQRKFEQRAVRGHGYRSALSPAEWKALQQICTVRAGPGSADS